VTRTLVHEDEHVRIFEIHDEDGNLIGRDEEPTAPPEEMCPTCGRPF
jgi:hypothetical protein